MSFGGLVKTTTRSLYMNTIGISIFILVKSHFWIQRTDICILRTIQWSLNWFDSTKTNVHHRRKKVRPRFPSTTNTMLPPSAVPHISHPPVPKSRGMTAEGELPRRGKRGHPGVSPRGEKPCPSSNVVRSIVTGTRFLQRLLPRGRSCHKKCHKALFMTDVGVAAPSGRHTMYEWSDNEKAPDAAASGA